MQWEHQKKKQLLECQLDFLILLSPLHKLLAF